MRGTFWRALMSAAQHSFEENGRTLRLSSSEDLDGTIFQASMEHTAGYWHRCNSFSHLSELPWRLREARVQLWRSSCSRSTRPIVRQALSPIVSRHGGWGFEARMPVPRAQARERHGRIVRQELTALEDIISDGSCGEAVSALYSKVARASGSSKFAIRAAGVRLEQMLFEFGMDPSTMNLKFARRWRESCKTVCPRQRRV